VYPTALAAGLRPHLLDRLPEAERAVGVTQPMAIGPFLRFIYDEAAKFSWGTEKHRAGQVGNSQSSINLLVEVVDDLDGPVSRRPEANPKAPGQTLVE
jgi:hypothetical protein